MKKNRNSVNESKTSFEKTTQNHFFALEEVSRQFYRTMAVVFFKQKQNTMNVKSFSTFLLSLMVAFTMQAQSPVGIWKTIDDETGEAKSHVEIFEKGGQFYGKVVKLLQRPADTICEECPGDKKNQKLVGLEILWDLKPYDDYWSYGQILDPENGKTYKCNLSLNGSDKLDVRGYIGFAALGRTQTWHRVN